ncbi:salicylate hydroxylase [Rubricella aquisinus]|uniref:Salicylate hydroxylase n=1 Tax=Rubricella aquisinus TaxID=2028108 RepID=A0A840WYY0_9RHOB|nr:FAD-dependent monooxygenase [Rubricella aquisinus]MBB5516350.1 salicylate hydroxylase [Rubricella aquisinus]
MALNGQKIAIAGGGIAGFASALALAQRGAAVTVHERAPELAEVGAGLQIGPNGMAVLDALGLGEAVRAAGTRPEAIHVCSHKKGAVLMTVPLGRRAEERWGRPYLHLHRADLLRILTEAARAAGVTVALGQTALGFDMPNGALRLEGGDVAADAVIGADGVRSALRSQMWEGQEVRFTGQVAWRGTIPASRIGIKVPPVTSLIMGPGKHIVIYRLRGGDLVNFVAIEERDTWTEESWTQADDPANLRAAFAGWCPLVTETLAACEETFLWGLFAHPVLPRWVDGNMALIGDAAHPMLPFLAQGAVMALEDAWVLAEALEQADDVPTGLLAYQSARMPRAGKVQAASADQSTLYHLEGPVRPLVQLGMRMVNAVAPGFGAGRYDWIYGGDVTR